MPISVKCPECEAPYKVPDEAAGKAIKCKKCGARISIPAAGAGDEGGNDFAGIGASGDSGGGETKEKKKGGSKKTVIIVAAVLVSFCCLCSGVVCVGGLYLMTQTQVFGEKFKAAIDDANKNAQKKDAPAKQPPGK